MANGTKSIALAALLAAGCVSTEKSNSYNLQQQPEKRQSLLNEPTNLASNTGNDHKYKMPGNPSTNIGPLTLSSSERSLQLSVGPFQSLGVELPLRSFYEEDDLSRGFESFDSWIVGNEQGKDEREPVPISLLGRAFKKMLFDNVKPIRDLSNELSRPVSLLFGDGAKFDVYKRDNDLMARIRLEGHFGDRWDCDYRLEIQVSDDGDTAAYFSMGIKGRKPGYR